MLPLFIQLSLVFLVGACLGSLVNWAIYALAWRPREISPWSTPPADWPARGWTDRLPVVGWFALRREATIHGRGFWVRPLFVELGVGVALAALYWWEVVQLGLIQGQFAVPIAPPLWPVHLQFVSHSLLLCWMLAASFIDIDEKIIPDEITVSGTLLGLVLATAAPMALLPHVAARAVPPAIGEALELPGGGPAVWWNGQDAWLEPVTAVAPQAWPPAWALPLDWRALVAGLACYWLWCFALAPRIWRGRRGPLFALWLIAGRICRELCRPPLRPLAVVGTAAIVVVWLIGGVGWNRAEAAWAGMLTALIGLVGSGAIVWAVRLVGTAALRREAMGFGDVTLMMMIGTFLGWQACMIAFFLAPFAGIFIGAAQFVLRRDDVIPYGPFLCLASATVVVLWAPIWVWAQDLFRIGWLVPLVLIVCLALLGVILALWYMIKTALFGRGA